MRKVKKAIIIMLVMVLVLGISAPIASANTGNDGIEQFVSRMYTHVLNRNVDRNYSGLRFWTNRLRNGTETASSVAHGFFFSNEFVRANHSNDVFLNRLYRAILGRGADERGFAYWTNHMNRGMSREGVLAGFINSREFGNLARQSGIERGTLTVAPAPTPAPPPAGCWSGELAADMRALGWSVDHSGNTINATSPHGQMSVTITVSGNTARFQNHTIGADSPGWPRGQLMVMIRSMTNDGM